ncbi:amidohydrolase/deacetylase family metallohydrolase [Paenibacillus sp. FSL K6-1217]|uniref:amidohydrolase/deacetylase family metallohydrolase n=1 Tax=Paenibacillus sp. FSL K6-1217 TaxID=2921466 RepID=UPI00325167AA
MTERLLLRRVRRMDGREMDLVVENGRIMEIVPAGTADAAGGRVWEVPGAYVSSGWIDLHVHAFPAFDPYGDEIDEIGVKQGVTTLVDAGSCGADRITELAEAGRGAATRLLAFLNISHIGLQRIDELSDMEWVNRARLLLAVSKHPDFIVGLKARISRSVVKDSGLEPLHAAVQLSEETGLPLMVHIGSGPPDIREVIPLLRKRDIITHYLNGKSNNLFDSAGQPLEVLKEAVSRGVHLDVGHGTASFSFAVAEAAKRSGFHPDTISSDIYRGNRVNGPVFSLAHVLNKFLALGYSLEETVARVTTQAADWLGRPELGEIRTGGEANLTLFRVKDQPVELVDSEGARREGRQIIEAMGVFVDGRFIECEIRAEAGY